MGVSPLDAAVRRISTSLLDVQPDVLAPAISGALGELCEALDVDRAYILTTRPDDLGLGVLENWWRPGVERVEATPIPELPVAAQRFWARGLRRGAPVVFDDLHHVSLDAIEAVADLMAAQVKSIVLVPLSSSKGTLGFTGFEARRAEHRWTDDEIAVVRTVGEMLLITIDRCRAESELQQAVADLAARNRDLERSNRDLEQFASIVSHDLKSPLLQVGGFVELLAKVVGDPESEALARSSAEAAQRGIARMSKLIDDLLAYARAGGGLTRREPVTLGELVADVVGELTAPLEPGAATVTVGPLPVIEGDPVQLRQLLNNLVANALKFHRPDQPANVEIGATRAGERWQLAVADDGVGIDPDHRDDVFAMFSRGAMSATPGTGVGLAIVARVVENHGGRVWVEDNPGGGARFVVELPAEGR